MFMKEKRKFLTVKKVFQLHKPDSWLTVLGMLSMIGVGVILSSLFIVFSLSVEVSILVL